ncbi:MAG TPA: VCBS repeat-containing protein [Vicinamibacterales bacterium]|jgi:putative transposon-encoded protein|nr:VCBS repeat-containing protein [Vicinamibacterales bacterium]
MIRKAFGTLLVMSLLPAAARAQALLPADGIDLSQVPVYNSPGDVASWPITTAITEIHMRPSSDPLAGLSLVFSGQQTWPNYLPPGWTGPLQYTVWAVWYANGQWSAAGIIQMWAGRPSTGAPILTDFARNWIYSPRWGPGWGHQPVVGEQMGFFVTAGDARGVGTVTSVRERSNVVMVSLPANDTGDFTFPATRTQPHRTMDFDGDGRTDIALFRPSNGTWYIGLSSTLSSVSVQFGNGSDIPVPGDYDGDGKTDVAVFRPSNGTWYVWLSSTQMGATIQFGNGSDIPVPGDYDGDGKTDFAVLRPATGVWYLWLSGSQSGATYQWADLGDVPVPADYDGDGKTDVAVFRPLTGTWYVLQSSTLTGISAQFGNGADIPVPRDYDGDGKADIAVFRPSNGTWYAILSSTRSSITVPFGSGGDIPVPGDYDGDGKADLVVFRPSNGTWYGWMSKTQTGVSVVFGNGADLPLR